MALGFQDQSGLGFKFRHSEVASQGIQNPKRIETASVVVAIDESGDFQDIQEAIESLNGEGGFIQVKEGDFTISSTISVPSNVSIEGVGFNTRVIMTTNTTHIFKNSDSVGGNTNISIQNIRCRGTNVGEVAAVHLDNVTNSKVKGINTERIYTCVQLENSDRVLISENISLDSNLGFGIICDSCFDCIITSNHIFGESVAIDLIDMENCIITQNVCNDAQDIGLQMDSACIRNVVNSNMCTDASTYGIYCEGDNNTITGNCCENAGIRMTGTSANNIVVANQSTVSNAGAGNVVANNVNI